MRSKRKISLENIAGRPASARPARAISWLILALAFAAAALQAVDPAALTQTTKYAKDGRLRLEYSALDRMRHPGRLRLWVAPGLAEDGRLRIRMNQAYTKLMRIDRITPEPERVETGLGDVIFVFKAGSPLSPMTVVFDVQPIGFGRFDGRLAVVGERSVEFTQYLVP